MRIRYALTSLIAIIAIYPGGGNSASADELLPALPCTPARASKQAEAPSPEPRDGRFETTGEPTDSVWKARRAPSPGTWRILQDAHLSRHPRTAGRRPGVETPYGPLGPWTGGTPTDMEAVRSRGNDWEDPDELPGQAAGLTDAFYQKVVQISARLQINPEDLLAVMYCESRLQAGAINPRSGACGLIQFMPATLAGLNFNGTPDDFSRLSETDQLTWVERFLRRYQPYGLDSAGRVYQAIFMPATLRTRSDVLVDSSRDPAMYARNAVLDLNADGLITVDDLTEFVNRKCVASSYRNCLRRLQQFE